MAFYKKIFKSFDTIYIGGGTPSLLSIQQIAAVLKAINGLYKIDQQAEVTIEVNPGDTSLEYFQSLRSLGINRLNIGVQSFDDRLLKFLGRRHSAADAIEALQYARAAGFGNIGIDLIYGIHGQDICSWKQALQRALMFSPEHVSCYQLSLSKKAPLLRQYIKDAFPLPTEDQSLDFFLTTSQILDNAGYIHYEVSNFAQTQDLRSRHNMKYWRHVPYLGLGPGAHSFIDNKRWWNKAAVKTYLKEIDEGKTPVERSEELSSEQLQLESLFLGMRTKDGIDINLYKTKYGSDLLANRESIIDELIKNRLVAIKDGFLRPTLAGMAIADSLALI